MSNKLSVSWPERFALLEHFKPSDSEACATFGVTPDELSTARDLLKAGTFMVSKSLDVNKYASYFSVPSTPNTIATTPTATPTATTFAKPESATKKPHVPKKRGRKGDKIQNALLAVPSTPVEIATFMQEQGVSLAVLRQAKRFASVHGDQFVQQVGTINVRQDKTTKKLMIWKS